MILRSVGLEERAQNLGGMDGAFCTHFARLPGLALGVDQSSLTQSCQPCRLRLQPQAACLFPVCGVVCGWSCGSGKLVIERLFCSWLSQPETESKERSHGVHLSRPTGIFHLTTDTCLCAKFNEPSTQRTSEFSQNNYYHQMACHRHSFRPCVLVRHACALGLLTG